MPSYLYWGEEDFNMELAVKRLRKKLLDPDWADFNHKVLTNPSLLDIIETACTIPMGPGNVLIEIYNFNVFTRKSKGQVDIIKTAQDEKLLKELIELIPELSERVHLLFILQFQRNSKKKVDKNLKTTKAIEKCGVIQAFEPFSPFQPDKVITWIVDAARELNVKINRDAASKLFECTGTELRKINSELNKLATYKGQSKTITLDDVNFLCSGIDNVFTLADRWVEGNRHSALLELRKILDKDHPVKIIATLQSILNEWLTIKLELKYGNKSTNLAQELGMHQYRLVKTIEKLRNVKPERISRLKEQLTVYENKIKTGQINAELAMEILMTM